MKIRLLAAVLTLVAGAGLLRAQESPKPGPEHQRLHYYVGEWKSEGAMKPPL